MARLYEDYELQLLLDCIKAQINDELEVKVYRDIDWGRLYGIAKNHRVANSLYTTTIRIKGNSIEKYRNVFDSEYRRAFQLNDKYTNLEMKLISELEKKKVHSMILAETILRKCYQRAEHRTPWDLEIYVSKSSIDKIYEIMSKLNFSENPMESEDEGVRFVNGDGLNVIFITSFKFSGNDMNMFFSVPPKNFPTMPKFQYIHQHNMTDFYIFYIARLSEKFINGEIKIRDVEDLWNLYLLCYDTIDWPQIYQEFASFKIGSFAELIIKLAANWFGEQDFEEIEEQIELMEAYIVSDGALFEKENSKLFPFESIKKVREQKRHQEKIKELFPTASYSEAIYPKVRANKLLKWYFGVSKRLEDKLHKIKYKWIKFTNKVHSIISDGFLEPLAVHRNEMAQKRLVNRHQRRLERALYFEKKMYEKEQIIYDRMMIKQKEREMKWHILGVNHLQSYEKKEYKKKKKAFEAKEEITFIDNIKYKIKSFRERKNKSK